MKWGLVVQGSDPETVWNAFRLGVYALGKGDQVDAFLLGKGVEAGDNETERFPVEQIMGEFVSKGGTVLACGTCLKLLGQEGSDLCPVSTMGDLYAMLAF